MKLSTEDIMKLAAMAVSVYVATLNTVKEIIFFYKRRKAARAAKNKPITKKTQEDELY